MSDPYGYDGSSVNPNAFKPEPPSSGVGAQAEPCNHDRLNEDGICRKCGGDERGIGGDSPSQQPSEQPKCGKFAASFIPRRGEYFSCVLTPGHEGECRPGGTCIKHGPYVGEANKPPLCPKWPKCTEPDSVDVGAEIQVEQRSGLEGLAKDRIDKFLLRLNDDQFVQVNVGELRERLRSHTSVNLRKLKAYLANEKGWSDADVEEFAAQFFGSAPEGV